MNTLTMERSAAAKLLVPRADALRLIKSQIDKGQEIKLLRIRNGEDLDKGRGLKLEWTQDNSDLLNKLFDNVNVADYCNDWVGKIFPEYAEFGNFVEQFYEEVEYRLNRLRAVHKRLEQVADGSMPIPAAPGAVNELDHEAPRVSDLSNESQAFASSPAAAKETVMAANSKVLFVSQGAHDPAGESIVQFVQQMALPVVSADLNNGLVETLEGRGDMGFVIVMNTSPSGDQGKAAVSDHVMFKLGYCAGKLGLKRMCMMDSSAHAPAGETHGIAHVPVDVNGGWQLHLARQMRRAGLDIDLNKLA